MLPITCIQPPCMNIDVNGVNHDGMSVTTHTTPSEMGTCAPGEASCSSSPGVNPSWQTERDSDGSVPKPCSSAHASTFAAMSP